MDLKTFIAETLTQIVDGVQDARTRIGEGDTNASLNPHVIGAHAEAEVGKTSPVEFDVAVTVVEQSDDKTGAKAGASGGFGILSVVSAKVSAESGVENQQLARNETVSRVKFSVQLAQPADIRRAPPQQPIPRVVTRRV